MKKVVSLLVITALVLSLCSCSSIEKHGLNEFSPYICDIGITQSLLPADNFSSIFEYESGDFYYYETGIVWGYVESIAYFTYSQEMYEQAKTFCLDSFTFCESHQYEHNGFIFFEHIKHAPSSSKEEQSCQYPKKFMMFAYNDDTCTLVFLGYYNGDETSDREYAETDFPKFLELTYSENYGFDA